MFPSPVKIAVPGSTNNSPTKPSTSPFGKKGDNDGYSTPKIEIQSTSHQKGKPRGGWDDDEDDVFSKHKPTQFNGNQSNTTTTAVKTGLSVNTGNKIAETTPKANSVTSNTKVASTGLEVKVCDEAFLDSHGYEVKMINELIQPGGARIKQSDAVLNDFCKASESLNVEVVGSILLNNLNAPIVWISKARTIYAIEAQVKKIKKYYDFYRHNLKKLRVHEFENEGVNASQLRKAMDDLIDFIEDPSRTPSNKQSSHNSIASGTVPSGHFAGNNAHPQSAGASINRTFSEAVPETKQEPLTAQNPSKNKLNPFGVNSGPNSAANKPASSGLPGKFSNIKVSDSPQKTTSTNSIPGGNQVASQQNAQQEKQNNILADLSQIDFSAKDPNMENINGIYNQYPNMGPYNGQNFNPMGYPPVHDPNMMGYPMQTPYGYSGPNFNPQFAGSYGQPPQVYPNPQYNPGYPMYPQPTHPQYMYPQQGYPGNQGHYDASPQHMYQQQADQNSQNQMHPQNVDQNGNPVQKQQEPKLTEEEIQKRKKQAEIESKFESLTLLLK